MSSVHSGAYHKISVTDDSVLSNDALRRATADQHSDDERGEVQSAAITRCCRVSMKVVRGDAGE